MNNISAQCGLKPWMPAVLALPAEGEPVSAVLVIPGSLFLDADGNFRVAAKQETVHPRSED